MKKSLTKYALTNENKTIVILSRTGEESTRISLDLKDKILDAGCGDMIEAFTCYPHLILLRNGTMIRVVEITNPEKLRGVTLNMLFVSTECVMPGYSPEELLTPYMHQLTPDGEAYFYKQ